MVSHAEADDELTEIMGLRIDLPVKFLRDLLQRATDAVRARLMAAAPANLQDEIRRVLKTIADTLTSGVPAQDYTRAEEIVKRMKGLNELTDKAIASFAETNRFNEVAAALAEGVPPEVLFDRMVASVPPGSQGLMLQPYWTPGIRMPGPDGRGAIIGFTDAHTRAHLYRAILEGLAYALREGGERWVELYLVFADRDYAGPGALRLAEIIRAHVAEQCRDLKHEPTAI